MSKRRPIPAPQPAPPGMSPLVHRLTLDRFEDDRDGVKLAVLITAEGRSIVVPVALLPAGATAGAMLGLTLAIDPEATAEVERTTKAIRADLKKTDPGGTIQL